MDHQLESETVIIAVEEDFCPNEMPALAMTYSPLQIWDCVFDADEGLAHGTIFPSLVKPFLEGACSCV